MKSETDRLVSQYRLNLVSPECMPDGQWWSAQVCFDEDISEALPYLNAELKKRQYHHVGRVLIWNNGGRRYAFRSDKIEIAPVESRVEAERLCREVLTLLQDVWDRRDRIEPDFKSQTPPPSLLSVLKLLPGTNCKDCGSLTCMAYAAALIGGQVSLSDCAALSEESLRKLADMLGEDIA